MTRLVISNICLQALSIVTVHKTAELEDNRTRYLVSYQTLKRNSYMDNVCRVAPDVDKIKDNIKEIE